MLSCICCPGNEEAAAYRDTVSGACTRSSPSRYRHTSHFGSDTYLAAASPLIQCVGAVCAQVKPLQLMIS